MTSGADDALAAHELDLVTSAAGGDEAAFDRFFDKHAPAVQLLAERLLGPGPAADGVVAEAFEKTVRRLPLLGARNSSPALYVLSTARNGAYASLGRERPTPGDGPLGALLKLPSRQRELLALRELGLTQEQCAEVAGVEPGEVGVQVARARLRLTDELEGVNLSAVFADDRAERLLAAEVVRQEGAPLAPALDEEIVRHADEDSRFAAALSAVRSPSRSVGQLPPATGSARLAADTRARAVGAGRPGAPRPATTASSAAAAGAAAAAAADAAAGAGAAAQTPPTPPIPSDPFTDIGDEAAWGIVDDDDDQPVAAPTAPEPKVESPTDGQWEDGAGAVSGEAATELVPTPVGPTTPTPVEPAAGSDPALADPFAGWDDVDWADDEDRDWQSGTPAAAAGAAGAAGAATSPADAAADGPASVQPEVTELTKIVPVAPQPPAAGVDLGETRAFDAVAAGLVDPEPGASGPGGVGVPAAVAAAGIAGGGEGPPPEEPRRRSPWRWVLWFVGLVALFVGAAFAAYAYVSAKDDPDLPPASTVTQTTPRETTSKTTPSGTTGGSDKPSSSSSDDDKPKASTPSSSSSSSGSTGSSGSSGGSGSTGSSGSSGGSGSTGSSGSSGGTGNSGSTANPPASGGTVTSGGESESGGSVRGESGTTP
ncbi:MAG: RNA polymerase sigma factor [Solirubrobacteraceae bacterium]|nr:RNA polymerase sigma factor [Solirubrobacteraceae bacterium]